MSSGEAVSATSTSRLRRRRGEGKGLTRKDYLSPDAIVGIMDRFATLYSDQGASSSLTVDQLERTLRLAAVRQEWGRMQKSGAKTTRTSGNWKQEMTMDNTKTQLTVRFIPTDSDELRRVVSILYIPQSKHFDEIVTVSRSYSESFIGDSRITNQMLRIDFSDQGKQRLRYLDQIGGEHRELIADFRPGNDPQINRQPELDLQEPSLAVFDMANGLDKLRDIFAKKPKGIGFDKAKRYFRIADLDTLYGFMKQRKAITGKSEHAISTDEWIQTTTVDGSLMVINVVPTGENEGNGYTIEYRRTYHGDDDLNVVISSPTEGELGVRRAEYNPSRFKRLNYVRYFDQMQDNGTIEILPPPGSELGSIGPHAPNDQGLSTTSRRGGVNPSGKPIEDFGRVL